MFSFLNKQKLANNEELRMLLIKKIFNSSAHTKVIRKSAYQSAKRQAALVERYNRMVAR